MSHKAYALSVEIMSANTKLANDTADVVTDGQLETKRNNRLSISQLYPTPTGVAGNCPIPPEIFAESDPPHFEKRRLRQISAYNVSTVRDTEKIRL